MTASVAPPRNTSEVRSTGQSRFDRRAVFGILSIAIALVIAAAGVRLFAEGFAHGAQRDGDRGLCYTWLDIFGTGGRSPVFALSACAWPVLVFAALGLAAFGVLGARKQASSRVRRLSWAGLISALPAALTYSVIFCLWLLGNLLCEVDKYKWANSRDQDRENGCMMKVVGLLACVPCAVVRGKERRSLSRAFSPLSK
jgi:hypothetical protein